MKNDYAVQQPKTSDSGPERSRSRSYLAILQLNGKARRILLSYVNFMSMKLYVINPFFKLIQDSTGKWQPEHDFSFQQII